MNNPKAVTDEDAVLMVCLGVVDAKGNLIVVAKSEDRKLWSRTLGEIIDHYNVNETRDEITDFREMEGDDETGEALEPAEADGPAIIVTRLAGKR